MPICSQCGTDNHANNVTCVYCHEPLNQKKQTFESFSNTQRSSSQ